MVLTSVLLAVEVSAEAHPIALSWQAPHGCPSASAVLAEVDRLLGATPTGDKRMVVDAQVSGSAQHWSLQMVIHDDAGEGEREISATTCGELADAAALIVALAFDPAAVAETRRRETTPPAPAAMPTPEPPAPAAPPAPEPAPLRPPPPATPTTLTPPPVAPPGPIAETQRVWFSVAPRIDFDAGTLPGVSLGVGGSLAVRWYPILARIRAGYFLPQSETLAGDKGGELDLWVVAAGMCGTPFHTATLGRRRPLDFALDGCVELEVGEMRGEGFGVRNPGSGATPWVCPQAQLWGALTLAEPLTARALVGVGVPVLRPEFVLREVGVVHTASPVVGRLGLEIAAEF